MTMMQPHDCPGCGQYYRPRHALEGERCYACAGLSFADHVGAMGRVRPAVRAPRPAPVVADYRITPLIDNADSGALADALADL